MDKLPIDVKRKIALELKPSDLIKFCMTEKEMYGKICMDNNFWRLKLERDYPSKFNYFVSRGLKFKNPRNTYIREFTRIANIIENKVRPIYPNLKISQVLIDIFYKYKNIDYSLYDLQASLAKKLRNRITTYDYDKIILFLNNLIREEKEKEKEKF